MIFHRHSMAKYSTVQYGNYPTTSLVGWLVPCHSYYPCLLRIDPPIDVDTTSTIDRQPNGGSFGKFLMGGSQSTMFIDPMGNFTKRQSISSGMASRSNKKWPLLGVNLGEIRWKESALQLADKSFLTCCDTCMIGHKLCPAGNHLKQ